jgi:hypothetical protein
MFHKTGCTVHLIRATYIEPERSFCLILLTTMERIYLNIIPKQFIWTSYQNNLPEHHTRTIYLIIPEQLIWTSYLNNLSEHHTRTIYLNIIPEQFIWTTYPNNLFEHHTRTIYLNIKPEQFIWKSYMNNLSEHHTWTIYLNIIHEQFPLTSYVRHSKFLKYSEVVLKQRHCKLQHTTQRNAHFHQTNTNITVSFKVSDLQKWFAHLGKTQRHWN